MKLLKNLVLTAVLVLSVTSLCFAGDYSEAEKAGVMIYQVAKKSCAVVYQNAFNTGSDVGWEPQVRLTTMMSFGSDEYGRSVGEFLLEGPDNQKYMSMFQMCATYGMKDASHQPPTQKSIRKMFKDFDLIFSGKRIKGVWDGHKALNL